MTYGAETMRWPALAQDRLKKHGPGPDGWAFTNYSANGLKASDYLTGGSVPPGTWKGNHDYYFVLLVANEGLVSPMTTDTNALVAEIEDGGGVAVLVTLYPVDYAGLHWRQDQGDKDASIIALNQVYRDIAAANESVLLCDLWQHVTDLGEWDYRIRNYPLVGGAVTDREYWGPDSAFDGDGSGGSDDPLWYTEIHPSAYGSEIIADAIVGFVETSLVATTTLQAFISEMISAIEGITPTTPLGARHSAFKLAKDEHDFRDWAEMNPGACTRVFTIYDLFEDDQVEVSDAVNDLQTKRVEVLVAYQRDYKYGAGRARDRKAVIREDWRKIDGAAGPHASTAYTVGCTIRQEGQPFVIEDDRDGVDILVIPFRCRFYEAALP